MTIVLIKLKWVHYNLNTRLCLNCILMSPNWLRWMLSLVVSNAETLSPWWPGHWWIEFFMSWSENLMVPLRVINVSETTGVTMLWSGDGWGLGVVTELSTPHLLLATGSRIQEITIVWSEMIMMMWLWHNWILSRKLELYFNVSFEGRASGCSWQDYYQQLDITMKLFRSWRI